LGVQAGTTTKIGNIISSDELSNISDRHADKSERAVSEKSGIQNTMHVDNFDDSDNLISGNHGVHDNKAIYVPLHISQPAKGHHFIAELSGHDSLEFAATTLAEVKSLGPELTPNSNESLGDSHAILKAIVESDLAHIHTNIVDAHSAGQHLLSAVEHHKVGDIHVI
jgi:hypothetical protein